MSLYGHCRRARHANRAVSPLSPKCRKAPRLNRREMRHSTTMTRLSTRMIRHPTLSSGDMVLSTKSRNENRRARKIPEPRRSHLQSPNRFWIKMPSILPTPPPRPRVSNHAACGGIPQLFTFLSSLFTAKSAWLQSQALFVFTSSPVRSSRSASCRFSVRRGRCPPASISPAARSPPRP